MFVQPVSSSPAQDIQASAAREPWFDARWHHRMYLSVNAGDHERKNYPVDTFVNFSSWIGPTSVIDDNSIRVLDEGVEIPSQYNSITTKTGQVIFVAAGIMVPHEIRNFTVYFDTEANGLKPVPNYGGPGYVPYYEELYTTLGSLPDNGYSWFPSYLDYSKYDHGTWVIGNVKASLQAWGDDWDGANWIRHHADVIMYRDSFNAYVHVYNNASTSDIAWASILLNFSTRNPVGYQDASLDKGLTVITDEWSVHDFSTFDWDAYGSLLAEWNVIDTYDQGFDIIESTTITYSTSTLSYPIVDVDVGGGNDVLRIVEVRREDTTLVPTDNYYLQTSLRPREVQFDWSTGTEFDDGEEVTITFFRKIYGEGDALLVTTRTADTRYVILGDMDDKDGVAYTNPEYGAIGFRQDLAMNNMVFEFWYNISTPNPSIPDHDRGDFFLNITANMREWWYNSSLLPSEQHDTQDNNFNFVMSYMNDTSDPEQDLIKLIDSADHPALISLRHDPAIPISFVVNSPLNGQVFNAWIELPQIPMVPSVPITVTVTGETVFQIRYRIGETDPFVVFDGTTDIDIDDINGFWLDGRVDLYVVVEDTNGVAFTRTIVFFVPKTFWQAIFCIFGSLFFIIISFIAGLFGIAIVAIANKRRKTRKGNCVGIECNTKGKLCWY
jgi:hypothetical protein